MPDTQPRGLYLSDGTFQAFDAESLTTEIATRYRAGDLFAFLGGSLGVLPDPDPILRARGDDAAILESLAADEQVTTAMLSRKYRVLNQRDYAFSPGVVDKEPDGAARLLCDRLIQDMESWTFTDILSGLLDAPFYGFTPLELIWKSDGGWWHLTDIIPRPYEWFGFNADNDPVWRGANMVTAETLPPGKFIFARHFPTYKNPYGLRLLSRCLWPVAFKKGGIEFYVRFVEKYGMPWIVGTAPKGAKAHEKREMAADLARMVQDAAAVIPAGSTVQLEAANGQVGDLHERFLKRWDAAISKVLMGQTLTAELDGKGSYAAAETHKDVADEMAEADRRLVESALNEIGWLYGQINSPTAACPIFAYDEKEDLKGRAALDEILTRVGVSFTAAYFERAYMLEPEDFIVREMAGSQTTDNGEASFSQSPTPESPQDFEKTSAAKAQNSLDAALEKALPDALKANEDFCKQLEKTLSEADSYEDAQLLLAEALGGKLDATALEDVLANMMLGAACFGRASVQAEAKEGE